MSVLGVVVVTGKIPRVQAVEIEGTLDSPTVADTFELRTASTNASEQAVDLARHLEPKLAGGGFEGVAIRVAGASPVGRRVKAAFSRAHCEGALIYVIRTATGNPVSVVDPVTAPRAIGWKRTELEELVEQLASNGANREALLAAVVALAGIRRVADEE